MHRHGNRRRWAHPAAVVLTLTVLLLAAQLWAPSPVRAVPGLRTRVYTSDGRQVSSSSSKAHVAYCPSGTQIVGGGAWADDFNAGVVMLTQLRPFGGDTLDPRHRYYAVAREPAGGFAGDWTLTVYAVCADQIPGGYAILSAITGDTPAGFKTTTAPCPDGKRVVGHGAEVVNVDTDGVGQVGLTLSRTAGPLDITRAAARVDASGYGGRWRLRSYSICASSTDLNAEGYLSQSPGGLHTCANERKVHSVGGGGGLTDTGPFFLQALQPLDDLNESARVLLTGTPVGGIAVQTVCGPRS